MPGLLLADNTLVEIVNSAGAAIGWGFAVPGGAAPEANQVQRFFFPMTVDAMRSAGPPNARVFWRSPALNPPWNNIGTLQQFLAQVTQSFVNGQHTYCKANCKHIAVVPPNPIPRPLTAPPVLPPAPNAGSQFDTGTGIIAAPGPNLPPSFVLTKWIQTREATEHFFLLPGYTTPAAQPTMLDGLTGDQFADLLEKRHYAGTVNIAITHCGY
jgi:hypothetical protein